jgi:hypothetical protein
LDEFFAAIGRPREPGEPAPEPFARPADVHANEAKTGYGPPIEGELRPLRSFERDTRAGQAQPARETGGPRPGSARRWVSGFHRRQRGALPACYSELSPARCPTTTSRCRSSIYVTPSRRAAQFPCRTRSRVVVVARHLEDAFWRLSSALIG